MKRHINKKHALLSLMILVFIGLLVLSALLAVTIGAVKVSIGNVYRVVIYQLSLGRIVIGENSGLASGTLYEIVWNLRMPRVLLGAVIGILLSMCGVVMQATVQNPLALRARLLARPSLL